MESAERPREELHTRYPLSSVLIYNGATLLHFLLGTAGLVIGYSFSWAGYTLGGLYLVFSFGEMYVLMPLRVCPNCVYCRMVDSRCVSGINVVAKWVGRKGQARDFAKRGEGPLCSNNLYLAALAIPVAAIIPALALNFSVLLLVIWIALLALLLFRFLVIFPKIACVHCRAKYACPQAESMGVRDL